jgi:hypothetical protein
MTALRTTFRQKHHTETAMERYTFWLRLCRIVLPTMFFWQHALMQDARYQDAPRFDPIKHHMQAMFHAAQAGPNVIAEAAQLRVVRKALATGFKAIEVADGLVFAPCVKSVGADVHEVGLGKAG